MTTNREDDDPVFAARPRNVQHYRAARQPQGRADFLFGLPVYLDPTRSMDEPVLVMQMPTTRALVVGTKPLPEHWREARLIVRRGLADVLDWLGEDPERVTWVEWAGLT